MKIMKPHFDHLQKFISPLDTPQLRDAYIAAGLSSMRYRWDLTYAAKLGPWICREVYPYANDDHIYTALRRIVPDLTR
jgi:hypothetical protein